MTRCTGVGGAIQVHIRQAAKSMTCRRRGGCAITVDCRPDTRRLSFGSVSTVSLLPGATLERNAEQNRDEVSSTVEGE